MHPGSLLTMVYLAQNVTPVYFWSLALIALLVAALAVMLLIRRRLSSTDERAANFTLADLRRMRDSGELTEEQFQKLRQQVIGSAKSTRP